jgi:hypothetical protein
MDTKSEDQNKSSAYKCRMQQCSVVVVWCTKQMTKWNNTLQLHELHQFRNKTHVSVARRKTKNKKTNTLL